jgi:hypothetical protein
VRPEQTSGIFFTALTFSSILGQAKMDIEIRTRDKTLFSLEQDGTSGKYGSEAKHLADCYAIYFPA